MSIEQGTRTPRPWPEDSEPTAEQVTAWLATCTPEERLEFVRRMLYKAESADRCFTENHDRRLDRLDPEPGKGRHRAIEAP